MLQIPVDVFQWSDWFSSQFAMLSGAVYMYPTWFSGGLDLVQLWSWNDPQIVQRSLEIAHIPKIRRT